MTVMNLFPAVVQNLRSRESSVGRATGFGLDARILFPAVQNISLLHGAQTESGAHPASYPMGTGGSYPRDKTARA
jgi:hypothetical protein